MVNERELIDCKRPGCTVWGWTNMVGVLGLPTDASGYVCVWRMASGGYGFSERG